MKAIGMQATAMVSGDRGENGQLISTIDVVHVPDIV